MKPNGLGKWNHVSPGIRKCRWDVHIIVSVSNCYQSTHTLKPGGEEGVLPPKPMLKHKYSKYLLEQRLFSINCMILPFYTSVVRRGIKVGLLLSVEKHTNAMWATVSYRVGC